MKIEDLKAHINFYSRIYGVLLILIGVLLILTIFILQSSRMNKVEQHEFARKAWVHYFQTDLKIPDETLLLRSGKDSPIVAGVDIALHDYFKQYNNRFYDSAFLDLDNAKITIHIKIPEWILDEHIEEYGVYQAINYAILLNRIKPSVAIKTLNIILIGGVPFINKRLSITFNYRQLLGVEGRSYSSVFRASKNKAS